MRSAVGRREAPKEGVTAAGHESERTPEVPDAATEGQLMVVDALVPELHPAIYVIRFRSGKEAASKQ
ncbi:hypothetical protein ASG84_11305 [Rhodococcus sp. Leaf278]|uniref:hypothetical protein n=1 Tax=Rhodococcus sp. Leaf278 TaxID=1736319 RepID=UPI00071300FF|nr:hypothetical protein [Rhodococcus sp. Leaf278]KQU45879.1 hypothetical protein ASG84_11305 [Rhodococcus sp. Leaf278]